jgi:hypothetical protein
VGVTFEFPRHVAAPAPVEKRNAPIWTAFNKYSRPGWTTYPIEVLGESFKPIYDELQNHGNPAWAGVEANAGMPGSDVDWETYLAWHYNHGCVLVGVNTGATGADLPTRLDRDEQELRPIRAIQWTAPPHSVGIPATRSAYCRSQGC